ncbi:MAG: methionine synthase [Ruminococcus sp.]|nr:methionine synthase [Ruminococcus sp.]
MLSLDLEPVNRREALRYMGFGQKLPEEDFLRRMDSLEARLIAQVRPRFIYRIDELECRDGCLCAGGLVLSGKSAAEHLEGCSHVIFLAATLSARADQLIAQAQARDMTDMLILDALASAGIEQICGKAEQQIREKLPEKYSTWRFSPGYGDLPLEIQGDLLRLLDAPRKIGLTVTETSILIPRKSVTALIGLSARPLPKRRRGCVSCNMRERCTYRNKGVHCSHVESASEE